MSTPGVHADTTATVFSLQGATLKFDTQLALQPYLDALDTRPLLEEIRLGGNTYGVEACEAIGKCLSTKKELQVADFSDIFTGRLISEIPPSLLSLCSSLLHLENLTTLDLSDNAFGGRSVEPMLPFISTHTPLRVLKLNNNGLGPAGGAQIADALLQSAQLAKKEGRPSNLRTFVCGRNRLENGSSAAFAAAFLALGTLEVVRMPQNGIRMEGIALLLSALSSNVNLSTLDLQDNTFTLSGSRAIVAALPCWPKLTSLNLSDCLLGARGGVLLASSLLAGSNPLLQSLALQSNDFANPSILVLASAIKLHGQHLVSVELNGNKGDEADEGYENVRAALEEWENGGTLDELDELEEVGEGEEGSGEDDEKEEGEDEDGEAETDELAEALGKAL